jgi:hypothetical protein
MTENDREAERVRTECHYLVASMPTSGLPEVRENLNAALWFYRERESHPQMLEEASQVFPARLVEVADRPEFYATEG